MLFGVDGLKILLFAVKQRLPHGIKKAVFSFKKGCSLCVYIYIFQKTFTTSRQISSPVTIKVETVNF